MHPQLPSLLGRGRPKPLLPPLTNAYRLLPTDVGGNSAWLL